MSKNKVSITLSKRWSQLFIDDKEIYFRGYFTYNGKLFTEQQLAEIIRFPIDSSFFKKINGEFTIIFKDSERTVVAVDRKRTIPLFYQMRQEQLIISDQLSANKEYILEDLSVIEFILTGYAAADRTLYKEWYQVEAGQILTYSDNEVKKENYFSYYHQPKDTTIEDAASELKKRFEQTFDQLVKRIKNKHVVLPLSGGYDSRIIALLLKEYGVTNITTFTYGKQSSKEALRSKEIADRLGLKWLIYPYQKQQWFDWYKSDEWQNYQDFATSMSSIAHIQDWPAVKSLLKDIKAENHEYVFIPGHSGDFIGGSHIPYELTIDQSYSVDDVVREIMKKHHRLWKTKDLALLKRVKEAIKQQLKGFPCNTNEESSALFEYWDWKERQGKFIINSLRVYEFYNQDWEIPLWDDSLVDFFLTVPVKYRFKKYLYDYTLNQMYPSYFEVPKPPVGAASLSSKYGALYPVLKQLYNKKELYSRYYKDPMEWYGITGSYKDYIQSLSFKVNGSRFHTPYNINSILVKNFIMNLKG